MVWCMRTNIVLNDDLISEALRLSQATSKSALVEEALRLFVEVRSEEQCRKTYKERLLKVQQAVANTRFRESSYEILRQDRER
ncbi:MAG: type II toxin-antitoxin system VapB family antitoxin [Deltaproteobacteria bacterium]|nr:type II toxin-antitoxin system VapB family antitoxin [Deltaproteobacteria bacterium]